MQIERVLVVDDELLMREFLGETLTRAGCEVVLAADGEEAKRLLGEGRSFDLVITDIRMNGMSGLDVLACVKEASPQTLVVLLTAHATMDTAIEAMRGGAFDYLTKPISPNQLEILLVKACEYRSLVEENRFYRQTASRPEDGFEDLVGRSDAMKEVFRLVDRVASSSATVLITGESGTGKELIARAIHQRSDRANKPFIRVNCAALPETLLESELFGHERGAFTGAVERRVGRFELAHTGTLLLDEISETSLGLQSKLLRILQEREFERVGGTKTVKVDVRVLCTSNRDLPQAVKESKFREDLFYRLNVVPIPLPPLRDRNGDITLLTEYFLRRYAERHRRPLPTLTPESRDALITHRWPGNVRELENTVERTVLLTDGGPLAAADLGLGDARALMPDGAPKAGGEALGRTTSAVPEADAVNHLNNLADVERVVILRVLQKAAGNRTQAARLLGISVRTLYTKLREYETAPEQKSQPEEVSA
jgi:DNA-binding NtrC family response regulator